MSQKSYVLNVNSREISNRKAISNLKEKNNIPAVIYGNNFKNINISVNLALFEKIVKDAKSSSIIDLVVDDKDHFDVLCQSVQTDYTGKIIHADFYKVNKDQELETEIQLDFIGEAPAKKLGFTVLLQLDSIGVKCLPKDLISSVQVDLSNLTKVDDSIKISDLILPKGIKVLENPNETVAVVHESKELDVKVDNTDDKLAAAQAEEAKKKEEKAGEKDVKDIKTKDTKTENK